MRQLIRLICLVSAVHAFAQWSANLSNEFATDNASYSQQSHNLRMAWSNGHFTGNLRAGWTAYQLDRNIHGIYAFSGQKARVFLDASGISESWWGQFCIGTYGYLSAWSVALTLARAMVHEDGKYTPRLKISRAPVTEQPLALSLQAFMSEMQAGWSWENATKSGDIELRLQRWESVNLSGRTANSHLIETETPTIIQISIWQMPKIPTIWDLGWAAQTLWSDRSVLYPTQTAPSYSWSALPAEAPRWSAAFHILLRSLWWQSTNIQWFSFLAMPVASLENRQWGIRGQTDWGTASLRLQTKAQWTLHSWLWSLSGELISKPWNHYGFFSETSWTQFLLKSEISKSF